MILFDFFHQTLVNVRRTTSLSLPVLVVLLSLVTYNHPAHALSVDLGLPSVLDPVTVPLSNITKKAPVTISSTPDSVEADVSVTPIVPLQAHVTTSVPAAASPTKNPVNNLAPTVRLSSSAPDLQLAGSPAQSSDPMPVSSLAPSTGAPAKTDLSPAQPKSAAGFMGSLFSNINHIASALAGKPVGTLPIIVSAAVFLVTLAAIGGIIYMSNKGGVLALGRLGTYDFSHRLVTQDMSQIIALTVGAFSLGIIAIFLALSGL